MQAPPIIQAELSMNTPYQVWAIIDLTNQVYCPMMGVRDEREAFRHKGRLVGELYV